MYNKLKCYTHLTFCYRWLALYFAVNIIFARVLVKLYSQSVAKSIHIVGAKKRKKIAHMNAIRSQYMLNLYIFLLLPSCICLLIFLLCAAIESISLLFPFQLSSWYSKKKNNNTRDVDSKLTKGKGTFFL